MRRRCNVCSTLVEDWLLKCPACGANQRITNTPVIKPTLEQQLGDLWRSRTPLQWAWRIGRQILLLGAIIFIDSYEAPRNEQLVDHMYEILAQPLDPYQVTPEPTAIPAPTSTPRAHN